MWLTGVGAVWDHKHRGGDAGPAGGGRAGASLLRTGVERGRNHEDESIFKKEGSKMSRFGISAVVVVALGLMAGVGAQVRSAAQEKAAAQQEAPQEVSAEAQGKAGAQLDSIVLGMGCFWGAEMRMAQGPGVVNVESGYANGEIAGDYEAILAHEDALQRGMASERNHAEVVKVTFDPAQTTLEAVLIRFWENHNPTQGDRQGNDVGSNYRSAIYYHSPEQREVAEKTREVYQKALSRRLKGRITTEIAPLKSYFTAEQYHQDYLEKNPNGYCGLGGTGIKYPVETVPPDVRQLVVFESESAKDSGRFRAEVLEGWKAGIPMTRSPKGEAPDGLKLADPVKVFPTTVLFEEGREVTRYEGYSGDRGAFWQWVGSRLLTPAQQKIAFEQGTERPGTGAHLKEKRPGTFVDPLTGAALFRSDTKFESGTGWPSFFAAIDGGVTLHEDRGHGMVRVEVRSASSGIHLGHVFDDGPAPTGKRYCINGNVLGFVPDAAR